MTLTRTTASGLLALGAASPAVTSTLLNSVIGQSPTLRIVPPDIVGTVQLAERFDLAVFGPGFFDVIPVHEHRLAVHNVVTHLEPSAQVIALLPVADAAHRHGEYLAYAQACGLKAVPDPADSAAMAVIHRRTARTTIHDLVAEARRGLRRLAPIELADLLAHDGAIVLDIRTPTDRERFGVIPGSIHAPRTTLEWMCDPASGYSHERLDGFEQLLVAVCNEGYSSSLAAASLQRLGFRHATDLIGGVMAWRAAGLAVDRPDHTHFS